VGEGNGRDVLVRFFLGLLMDVCCACGDMSDETEHDCHSGTWSGDKPHARSYAMKEDIGEQEMTLGEYGIAEIGKFCLNYNMSILMSTARGSCTLVVEAVLLKKGVLN
jgi:hypothetical protein